MVNSIATSLSLGFSDEELPTEGRNHNKALHISIECVDIGMSRVLVDTGSSLNMLPKSSLSKLTIKGVVMKPSKLVVRAFDGSRRTVVGEVDLPIKIAPYFLHHFLRDGHISNLQLFAWTTVDTFSQSCYFNTPSKAEIFGKQQASSCGGRIRYHG